MATARVGVTRLVHYHHDYRRVFWGDIFPMKEGDINLVAPRQNVFIGWHRHQHQDDSIFVISGVLRVRVFETTPAIDGVEWILANIKGQLPILIPRNRWHGYEALTDDTMVLQFNGPGKWDGSDEERLEVAEMPWDRQ